MAVTQRCEFTNPALLSPLKHSFFTALLYPVTHYKEGPHPLCKEVPPAEPCCCLLASSQAKTCEYSSKASPAIFSPKRYLFYFSYTICEH